MRYRLFLALCLTAIPHSSPAARSGPVETTGALAETAETYVAADAAYAEAMKSLQRLQECRKLARQMSAGADEKESALKAEFGGRVPREFNDLLHNKRKRANKQENLCVTMEEQPAKLFMQAHQALKQIQPYNLPGVAPRKKRLEKARVSYNQMFSSAKPEPK